MKHQRPKPLRCTISLLLAFLLLLSGCGREAAESSPPQMEESPTQAADTPSPEVSAPPSPSPTPEPTEEVKELWDFPIDNTHDAFEVPTGGRLGTVVVTADLGEKSDPDEFGPSPLTLSVWSPDDLTAPIQVIQSETDDVLHWSDIVDANFDGYMDFGYMYAMGNQPQFYHFWIWDEEQGLFVAEPEFDEISCPQFDPETGIIDGWARYSAAGDGLATFHRWEDGKLVCVRRITANALMEEAATLLVEDREDGELKEVFYREYPWEEIAGEIEGMETWWQDRMKWEDLSYHGET